MARREYSFFRDLTFHNARRIVLDNLYSTDLDFLEYCIDDGQVAPKATWELKSQQSQWKSGVRVSGIKAQKRYADMAGLPYYVVEHSPDFSSMIVYEVNQNAQPLKETRYILPDFFGFLYEMRGMAIRPGLLYRLKETMAVLEPLTRVKLIEKWWMDLSREEREGLLVKLSQIED